MLQKIQSFLFREFKLITVLLLIRDFYISSSARFVSLKVCVAWDFLFSIPFRFYQNLYFCSQTHLMSFFRTCIRLFLGRNWVPCLSYCYTQTKCFVMDVPKVVFEIFIQWWLNPIKSKVAWGIWKELFEILVINTCLFFRETCKLLWLVLLSLFLLHLNLRYFNKVETRYCTLLSCLTQWLSGAILSSPNSLAFQKRIGLILPSPKWIITMKKLLRLIINK